MKMLSGAILAVGVVTVVACCTVTTPNKCTTSQRSITTTLSEIYTPLETWGTLRYVVITKANRSMDKKPVILCTKGEKLMKFIVLPSLGYSIKISQLQVHDVHSHTPTSHTHFILYRWQTRARFQALAIPWWRRPLATYINKPQPDVWELSSTPPKRGRQPPLCVFAEPWLASPP